MLLEKAYVLFQIMSSCLTIRDTGCVAEIDRLGTDKTYLILNAYFELHSKRIILKLRDDNDGKKEGSFIYLPITHRSEPEPFTRLQMFNINANLEYYKIRYLGYVNWATIKWMVIKL